MMALLLPLLLISEKLKNCHICIHTDNMSCVFGMKDGYVKNQEYASIFIRAAYLIEGFLGSIIHVSPCPRRSSWESRTADNKKEDDFIPGTTYSQQIGYGSTDLRLDTST
jgi:hypothetical protein